MTGPMRAFLSDLFRTAVAAAHPATCLPPCLPMPPTGKIILLAAGKAAGSMAEVAEGFYLDWHRLAPARLAGIAVARHGYGRPTRAVTMIEAGHPIPDARLLRPPVEGRVERGSQGLDVGDRVRVQLISTDVERGFVDFARA